MRQIQNLSKNFSTEFISQIYELIFSCADEKGFDELCEERREILSLMKNFPSNIESVVAICLPSPKTTRIF